MKFIKVNLPDDLYAALEGMAKTEGLSLSGVVRKYVENGISFGAEPTTQDLMQAIPELGDLVKRQTGEEWWDHPLANKIMQDAVMLRIQRAISAPSEAAAETERPPGRVVNLMDALREQVANLKELPPDRPVASNVPENWALVLEAIEYANRRKKRGGE